MAAPSKTTVEYRVQITITVHQTGETYSDIEPKAYKTYAAAKNHLTRRLARIAKDSPTVDATGLVIRHTATTPLH